MGGVVIQPACEGGSATCVVRIPQMKIADKEQIRLDLRVRHAMTIGISCTGLKARWRGRHLKMDSLQTETFLPFITASIFSMRSSRCTIS